MGRFNKAEVIYRSHFRSLNKCDQRNSRSAFHQSNLTKSLKISRPQLFPRALHKQAHLPKRAAKFDRRETEIFRKAHQSPLQHRHRRSPGIRLSCPPCTAGSCSRTAATKWFEALDQSLRQAKACATNLEEGLSSQFFRGHAVGIGHIDDRLPPARWESGLRDIRVRLETDSQKKKRLSALTRFPRVFWE